VEPRLAKRSSGPAAAGGPAASICHGAEAPSCARFSPCRAVFSACAEGAEHNLLSAIPFCGAAACESKAVSPLISDLRREQMEALAVKDQDLRRAQERHTAQERRMLEDVGRAR